jgi:hypothetical protein
MGPDGSDLVADRAKRRATLHERTQHSLGGLAGKKPHRDFLALLVVDPARLLAEAERTHWVVGAEGLADIEHGATANRTV